jgi:hypothetical protein
MEEEHTLNASAGRGGARPGAGRPIADIQLDQEHARMLKHVLEAQGQEYTTVSAAAYVMRLIAREHQRHDDNAKQQGYTSLMVWAAEARRRDRGRR